MSKKILFYKDLSGLRFIGILFLFIYTITYLLLSQDSSILDFSFLPQLAIFRDLGVGIFFVISAFLLTAHGLREYKYKQQFNLKKFYLRRLLRLAPTLSLALLFYFVVHPSLLSFLSSDSLTSSKSTKAIPLFVHELTLVSTEVITYLFFIYAIFIILQYYVVWGLILKFLKQYLSIFLVLFFIIGAIFKLGDSSIIPHAHLYLPYYFLEIAIGGFTAVLMRNDSQIISVVKGMSLPKIVAIYTITICSTALLYIFTDKSALVLIAKLLVYLSTGFYIIEQTYAKHSLYKFRENNFIIQFGNLSYGFIIFLPMVAIMLFMLADIFKIQINTYPIILGYSLICFIITWVISVLNHHYIDVFFIRLKKKFRPV